MGYDCKIIADSMAPNGKRLTTFQVTFPRIILAEFNTHRQFSRNSASSRAIPVEKQIQKAIDDPFLPVYWGKNQKGMQADQELTEEEQSAAIRKWLDARDSAVKSARAMLAMGVHKQITNRLLEPFLWHTAIVSSTEYSNFFAQRCHPDAQPEIRHVAEMMRTAMLINAPACVKQDDWHTPYILPGEFSTMSVPERKRVSVARCARVSYEAQDGVRDIDKDMELYTRLTQGFHWSPFEHVAQPSSFGAEDRSGNFFGWEQFRKEFANECR